MKKYKGGRSKCNFKLNALVDCLVKTVSINWDGGGHQANSHLAERFRKETSIPGLVIFNLWKRKNGDS